MSLILDGTNGLSDVDGTAAAPALRGTDTNTGIFFPAADQVAITTGGTQRAVVDASGFVGIGTSSPTQALTVNGQMLSIASSGASFKNITPTTGNNFMWLGNTGNNLYVGKESSAGATLFVGSSAYAAVIGNDGAYPLQFATNNNVRATIDSSGNINLNSVVYNNTTVNAANMFLNSGPIHQIYRSTSSIRYKTNVETIEDSYSAALLQCRPVWFRSLCGGDNKEHGYWGFIAEEVAAIDPRLVFWTTTETTQNENGESTTVDLETPIVEGVQYDRFVPHLLNLIKKQNETITALTTRITALEGAAA
jgi:hypothetical protein